MALPKIIKDWRSTVAGAAMAGLATFVPAAASAQDAALIPVVQLNEETGKYEMPRDEEIRLLREADAAATDYAMSCFEKEEKCVGVMVSFGDNFYAQRDALAAQHNVGVEVVEAYAVDQIQKQYAELFAPYGIEVAAFPTPNPGTGIDLFTFHVKDILHETEQGVADLPSWVAEAEIPRVTERLDVLRRIDLLQDKKELAFNMDN